MKLTAKGVTAILATMIVSLCVVSPAKSQNVLTQEDFDHIPQGLVTGKDSSNYSGASSRNYTGNSVRYRNHNRLNHEGNQLNHDSYSGSSYDGYYDHTGRSYRNSVRYLPNGDWVERGYR
jgi:hypothetical protein